jgi:hypothetical protein
MNILIENIYSYLNNLNIDEFNKSLQELDKIW